MFERGDPVREKPGTVTRVAFCPSHLKQTNHISLAATSHCHCSLASGCTAEFNRILTKWVKQKTHFPPKKKGWSGISLNKKIFSVPGKKKKKLLIRHNLRQSLFSSAAMPAVTSCISSSSIYVIFEKRSQQASPPLVSICRFWRWSVFMVQCVHTSNLSLQRWVMKTRNLRNPAALQGKTYRGRKLLPFLFAIPPNESKRTGLSSVFITSVLIWAIWGFYWNPAKRFCLLNQQVEFLQPNLQLSSCLDTNARMPEAQSFPPLPPTIQYNTGPTEHDFRVGITCCHFPMLLKVSPLQIAAQASNS